MNVEILWKNRNNLKEFFPENLIFSGMRINVQNEKIGYAYFFDELIELKINENIGNSKVIDIFENGILLLTEDGNFEVIL
jgi:hypothetical protein